LSPCYLRVGPCKLKSDVSLLYLQCHHAARTKTKNLGTGTGTGNSVLSMLFLEKEMMTNEI
jgi:hypothetical protein